MDDDDVLVTGEAFEDPSLFDYLFVPDDSVDEQSLPQSEESHLALMAL